MNHKRNIQDYNTHQFIGKISDKEIANIALMNN